MGYNMNRGFRYFGEFEKQQAVVIFWPLIKEPVNGYDAHAVFAKIVKELSGRVDLYINCGYEGMLQECRAVLNKEGIDLERIHFSQFPDATNWTRDYGPDIMLDENGKMQLVNFRFNMYGQSEETFEKSRLGYNMGPHMGIVLGCRNIICPAIFSEGGDRELNGKGVMITIEETEVTKRNPGKSKAEVEQELKKALNLEKVIWLPFACYEDEGILEGVLDVVNGECVYRSASANGHIDEMARFVDEHTILLAEVTDEEAAQLTSARISKERLDEAYRILCDATDQNGDPFRIVRIPCPDPIYIRTKPGDWTHDTWGLRFSEDEEESYLHDGTPMPDHQKEIIMQPALSYCNFLICNEVVLTQCYWEEGMPESIKKKDEKALEILSSLFPERKIVPIHTLALNIMGGGIHCVTKNIPAPQGIG